MNTGYTIAKDGTWRKVTPAEYNRRAEARQQVEYLRKIALNQTGAVKAETIRNIRKIIKNLEV